MASNFKRIKFFQQDQIEDPLAAANKQAKRGEEVKQLAPRPGERTIQDVNVIHMIYLDMFFLFLGTPALPPAAPGEAPQYAPE
jgi:hypothetical protein